jgi:hypothetical protein
LLWLGGSSVATVDAANLHDKWLSAELGYHADDVDAGLLDGTRARPGRSCVAVSPSKIISIAGYRHVPRDGASWWESGGKEPRNENGQSAAAS